VGHIKLISDDPRYPGVLVMILVPIGFVGVIVLDAPWIFFLCFVLFAGLRTWERSWAMRKTRSGPNSGGGV